MKKLIMILTVLSFSLTSIGQTNSKYEEAMKKALAQMDAAKDEASFTSSANTFERIANNEKEKWEPLYYFAFIKTVSAFGAQDKAAVGEELAGLSDKLSTTLEFDAVQKDPKTQSEIHTLIAMMYSARMMANPMTLGAKFGPLNAKHLATAIQLNENNPRAYLLQAQGLFYTPEAFGGNKAKAKKLAEKALALFEKEDAVKASGSWPGFMPSWGKDQVNGIIQGDQKEKE